MKKNINTSTEMSQLRKNAEKQYKNNAKKIKPKAAAELSRLVQELEIHEIELEMQNDQLRKSKEDQVESHNKYIDLFEFAPVGCFILNEKGLITDLNLTACGLFGSDKNKLINKPLSKIIQSEDQDTYYLHFKKLIKSKEKQQFDLKMKGKGEKVFFAEITAILQQSENNDSFIRLTINDVSERKLAREALYESEDKFRTYIENSPIGVFVTDENGKYCDCNKAALELIGYSRKELLKKNIFDLSAEHEQKNAVQSLKMLKNKKPVSMEIDLLRKDSSHVSVILEATSLPNGGFLAFCTDITERKSAEEKLKENEERFRLLYQRSPLGYQSLDLDGKFLDVNPAWLEMLGYTSGEVIGKWFGDFLTPKYIENFKTNFPKFKEAGFIEGVEFEMETKSGKTIFAEIDGKIGHDNEGNFKQTHCVVKDITQKKQVQKELLKKQYYLTKAQEIGKLGTWEMDFRKNIITWTEENYKIFGVPLGTNMNFEKFIECVHADDKKHVAAKWNESLKNKPYDIEHRIIVDNKIKWVREKADFEFDKNGNPLMAIGFTQDITERKITVERLENTRRRLELAADSAGIGVWDLDLVNDYLTWDKWMFKLYGIDPEGFENAFSTWEKGVHPDDLERINNEIKLALSGEKEFNTEFRITKFNGQVRYIKANAVILKDDTNTPVRMIGTNFDITENKLAQEALIESEEKYRSIFENSALGIFRSTPEGKYEEVNEAFARILGFSFPAKMIEEVDDISKLYKNPADREKIKDLFARNGFVEDYEVLGNHSKNEIVWISINASAQFDKRGKIIYEGTIQDITERKLTEGALIKSEKKYRSLYENMTEGVFYQDKSGQLIDANESALDLFGLTRDQFFGRTSYHSEWKVVDKNGNLLSPEEHPSMKALNSGVKVIEDEVGVYNPITKNYKWMLVNATPQFQGKDENPSHVFLTLRDITERKNAGEALKKSEEKFRTYIENSPIAVLVTDENGKYCDCNKAALELTGYSRKELLNLSVPDMAPEQTKDKTKKHFQSIKEKGYLSSETRFLRKNGSIVPVIIQGTKLPDNKYVAFCTDISDRKIAENALIESEKRLKEIITNTPAAYFKIDKEGHFVEVNDAWLKLHKYSSSSEIIGQHFSVTQVPENLKQGEKTVENLLGGEPILSNESARLCKDGTIGYHSYSANSVYQKGEVVGLEGFLIDITENKMKERALLELSADLNKAQEVTHVGNWKWDIKNDKVIWSDEMKRIWGLDPKVFDGDLSEIIRNSLHPEDINKVNASNNSVITNNKPIPVEYKIIRADQSIRHVWAESSELECDDEGNAIMLKGIVQDITERKEAEIAIIESEKKYRSLFENQLEGYAYHKILLDEKGKPEDYEFIDVNTAFLKQTGLDSRDQIVGKRVLELWPGIEKDWIEKYSEVALTGKGVSFLNYSSIFDRYYKVNAYSPQKGFFATSFSDITIRKKAEEQNLMLLESARLVLENKPFEETARTIFEYCKVFTGATAGYVALISEDGCENEVLFLNFGGKSRNYDKRLAIPIKGLKAEAYKTKSVVFDNSPRKSKYEKLMPSGHVKLNNVLFSPLVVQGKSVGLVGLANKNSDFTEEDAKTVKNFSEYISIALLNGKNLKALLDAKNEAENYLNTAGVMMIALDKNANVTMINEKGSELLGYTKKYILGKNWIESFIPKEEKKLVSRVFRHLMDGVYNENKYVEGRVLCRYKKSKIIGWRNTILRDSEGTVIGSLSSGEDITEMIRMSEEINSAQRELSTLSQHIENVREEEKTNLSRAIHDELGQAITALKLDTSWIFSKIRPEEEKIKNKLLDMSYLLNDTLDKVQKIAYELRPDFLDHLGLIPAIQYQLKDFEEKTGIKFIVRYENELLNIGGKTSTVLYRTFQESIANIIRHSQARKATVSFVEVNGKVFMYVKDNGIGMEEKEQTNSKSLGLIGMRERVKMIGGEITFESKPGRGTTVKVSVPQEGENVL